VLAGVDVEVVGIDGVAVAQGHELREARGVGVLRVEIGPGEARRYFFRVPGVIVRWQL